MVSTRQVRIAALVLIVLTGCGIDGGSRLAATQRETVPRNLTQLADICTGVLGLTRTQTARLNVLNEGDSALIVEIMFRAANSTILSRSGVIVIPPDEGAFFDLDGATVAGERERLALYGMVFFSRQAGAVHSPNVTFELFDSETLETSIVLAAAHR